MPPQRRVASSSKPKPPPKRSKPRSRPRACTKRVPVAEARRIGALSKAPFRVLEVHPREFKDGHWGLQYRIGRVHVEHSVNHYLVDKRGWRAVVDAWWASGPAMTKLQLQCEP
jgi:hypothetical protein